MIIITAPHNIWTLAKYLSKGQSQPLYPINHHIWFPDKRFFHENFNLLHFLLKHISFQVDDQMKLLQDSWSEMLILDHIHHR